MTLYANLRWEDDLLVHRITQSIFGTDGEVVRLACRGMQWFHADFFELADGKPVTCLICVTAKR